MPELRHNILTREWVIIATERARRPEEFAKVKKEKRMLPPYVVNCPFCPGNEQMTPPETYVVPDTTGWRVRVTPNKFAALSYEGERQRYIQGIRRTITGVGIHEVIVETPDHSKTTALLHDRDVETIIATYLNRFQFASQDSRVEQVTIFKNHGEAAGTSLEHPHSQIIGTPVITAQLRDRLINSLKHFDEFGECIFCRVLEQELRDQLRIVLETEHFVSFVQFATLTPFSMLIMPRRHMSCFAEIRDAEAADLARNLRRTLGKLYHGLDNPDFNYTIRTAPAENCGVKYFHWYVSIIPRLTRMAGFELGSGMFINISLPENDAKFLREVQVD
ncbi:MAG TPA: galactose-1-phosphate uridylyltransferase [Terriglobia bacterium]|jgi:UDPglucose--hexose-1-phosphate uridylyltransferase|nr:galactose-1-phosphate uridylyltransferase [Terriglobia bacterium]